MCCRVGGIGARSHKRGGLAMDWLGSMHGLRCYAYLYLCFLDWDT